MKPKTILTKICLSYLLLWVFVALFSPLISGNKPIIRIDEGSISFPFLENKQIDWKTKSDTAYLIWPLIPFDQGEIDLDNIRYQKPGSLQKGSYRSFKHYLGTDRLGRDVLAILINGARISMIIVLFSIAICLIIGVSLGISMGYFGDNKLRIGTAKFVGWAFLIIVSASLLVSVPFLQGIPTFILIGILALALFKILKVSIPSRYSHFTFPLDLLASRVIEVFLAVPKMILIIAVFAGFVPSISKVIVLIGLISWPGIAKIVRAETLKEKEKIYILSSKTLGLSNFTIIIKHLLPNILPPILVYIAFLSGSIIILESSLSFLGFGLPPEIITWGKLLAQSRQNMSAWWLALFPGFFIFASVFSLNTFGRALNLKSKAGMKNSAII